MRSCVFAVLLSLLSSGCGVVGVEVGVVTTRKVVEKARVYIWTTPAEDVRPGHPGCCGFSGTYPCGNHRCCMRCHTRCGF